MAFGITVKPVYKKPVVHVCQKKKMGYSFIKLSRSVGLLAYRNDTVKGHSEGKINK